MFTIGAFAQLSGLSAKTLRYYHDRGLLVPAQVDPETGYRSYTLRQLDDAVRISVLRRGGMPIERIREVLENPDRAESLIRDFHEEVRRRRLAEDQALNHVVNAPTRDTVTAHTRDAPAVSYAAVTVRVDAARDTDPEHALAALNERVDDRADAVRQRLVAAGMAPTGAFWTVLGADGDALAVTVHWPLPEAAAPAKPVADGVQLGRLPARREVFVEVPEPEHDGDASIQLAISTVLAAAGEGNDITGLRQTVHRDRATVEYALTLREHE